MFPKVSVEVTRVLHRGYCTGAIAQALHRGCLGLHEGSPRIAPVQEQYGLHVGLVSPQLQHAVQDTQTPGNGFAYRAQVRLTG